MFILYPIVILCIGSVDWDVVLRLLVLVSFFGVWLTIVNIIGWNATMMRMII